MRQPTTDAPIGYSVRYAAARDWVALGRRAGLVRARRGAGRQARGERRHLVRTRLGVFLRATRTGRAHPLGDVREKLREIPETEVKVA